MAYDFPDRKWKTNKQNPHEKREITSGILE